MRFRSIGASASNIGDYLTKIKEEEDKFIYESILSHIGFISLEESKNRDGLLGPNSIYKLTTFKNEGRRRRRKILKSHYRKKLYFHHQKCKINSNDENIISNSN